MIVITLLKQACSLFIFGVLRFPLLTHTHTRSSHTQAELAELGVVNEAGEAEAEGTGSAKDGAGSAKGRGSSAGERVCLALWFACCGLL